MSEAEPAPGDAREHAPAMAIALGVEEGAAARERAFEEWSGTRREVWLGDA